MKTAQIITRTLNGITFTQNHKTEMVNLTQLVDNFNRRSDGVNKGIPNTSEVRELQAPETKRLDNFIRLRSTNDFLAELALSEGCEQASLMQVKRGKYGGTWAHPLVFVKLCCWLSPKFEVAALQIVYDHLLEYRDQSGDNYRLMCHALDIHKVVKNQFDYIRVATSITFACLGTTNKECWNDATEHQLQRRNEIELFITNAVKARLLTDMDSVLKYLSAQ